jgi:hypothetical protein
MTTLFTVKRIVQGPAGKIRAYWIESTAPLNVDDRPGEASLASPRSAKETCAVKEALSDSSVDEIAAFLNEHESPEVVITVHGFNNPVDVVLRRYQSSFAAVAVDPAISAKPALACIGYKWPSEGIFWPAGSSIRAAPGFLIGVAVIALAFLVLAALWLNTFSLPAFAPLPGVPRFWIYLLSLLLFAVFFAVPAATVLLRAVVYFRDGYRAAQYGVPDLVEVIRRLDMALDGPLLGRKRTQPVKLSFIGHSMGAFVVTSLVRILSDVFGATWPPNSPHAEDPNADVERSIGKHFCLGRLVLVSPDIPAEALLTRRANFLGPSLRRFEEAYLFSNEGDVVLRLISTLANYFSFPTRSRKHGFRLGNTEVVDPMQPNAVAPPPGIVNKEAWLAGSEPTREFPRRLRVGALTLDRLDHTLQDTVQAEEAGPAENSVPPLQAQPSLTQAPRSRLLERFSYFDCTDYKEDGRAYLSRAKRRPRLGWWNQWSLLLTYLLGGVDVHSGYFDGPVTRSLIYRLACLGFLDLVAALAPPRATPRERVEALDQLCRATGIQVLLSPELFRQKADGLLSAEKTSGSESNLFSAATHEAETLPSERGT